MTEKRVELLLEALRELAARFDEEAERADSKGLRYLGASGAPDLFNNGAAAACRTGAERVREILTHFSAEGDADGRA